ncbi:MAG: type II and III secretion system protein [Ignavibacteria bacterium]|nr:type II and III secretion system protein [Ignavibacteria bacterium]MBI3765119.1 type II and III secretion system protein [Ignavibacteriales bacterium]
MKKPYVLFWSLLLCLSAVHLGFGQARDTRLKTKGYISPQEIVSLDSTMRMDQALLVINELSKQFAGKIIVDLEKRKTPIGVYIVNQHWRDALEMILSHAGLTYVEEPDYIRIVQVGAAAKFETGAPGGVPTEPPPTLDSRDVKISAVFFTTDVTKLQNYGIGWNFFRQKDREPKINTYVSAGVLPGDTLGNFPPVPKKSIDKAFTALSSPPQFTFANIDALVKFFGSNDLGEVITSPEVTVRNGKLGKIQVGADIYITTRDIAGNTINQQVSTGTIIEVTPTVYTQKDTDFIYLNLSIEQSTFSPGPIINKDIVKTHALLYDGEETVIGGLYTTSERETREGIPFLKDLPGWFLGLRYLFGSESKTKIKNELIVLLKAELLQPIRNRIKPTADTEQNIINKKRSEYLKEFEKK